MPNSFVISDTHFSHENSWAKFKNPDGTSMRNFTSTEEMDEYMVECWNSVVGPSDKVYHLGDVSISKKGLEFVKRLNGKKRLVRGNHDIYKDKDYYAVGFEQIHGVRVFVDQFILSHIPLHPESVSQRFIRNVHGHLHNNFVKKAISFDADAGKVVYSDTDADERYVCVSVERINYTPISFDEINQKFA